MQKFESASPLTNGSDGALWKRYWEDLTLQEAGYSYDFLSPALLDLPNALVTDKKLAVDGPDYDVLVINTGLKPRRHADSRSCRARLRARSCVSLATASPSSSSAMHRTGRSARATMSLFATIIGDLLTEPTVHEVAVEGQVPACSSGSASGPCPDPDKQSNLMTYRRDDQETGTQYFSFYNQGIVDMPDPAPGVRHHVRGR